MWVSTAVAWPDCVVLCQIKVAEQIVLGAGPDKIGWVLCPIKSPEQIVLGAGPLQCHGQIGGVLCPLQ